MGDTLFLFVVIFVSVAAGWLAGRVRVSQLPRSEERGDEDLRKTYFQGLNYLLNEQPDQAIDSFVSALEVNSETLETHLALGSLLRRKGEIERAIRVHQNILARPGLSAANQQYAQYELARDYIGAGLLDRAERILESLVSAGGAHAQASRYLLIEIYEDEREWQKALDASQSMVSGRFRRRSTDGATSRAHYCLELADDAKARHDFTLAEHWVKRAFEEDKHCGRADLFAIELAILRNKPNDALSILKSMSAKDSRYLPEGIETLDRLNVDVERKRQFLEHVHKKAGSSWLVAMAKVIELTQGQREAAEFLGQQMRKHSSIRGLLLLTKYHVLNSKGEGRANLELLESLLQQLLDGRPLYRCTQCGFSGKKLHWHCPSCRGWGTIKRIRAIDGE